MRILVVNAGSTSLKVSLFDLKSGASAENPIDPISKGQVDWQGSKAKIKIELVGQGEQHDEIDASDRDGVIQRVLNQIAGDAKQVEAVGHRIVHGGGKYWQTVQIDEPVLNDLASYIELAPDHVPENVRAIKVSQQVFPAVPHYAVFDTAFHHTLLETASIYAGPYEWYEKLGIKRFGFHGISHQYISTRVSHIVNRRLQELNTITCHLGGGASLCAVEGGISIMTTMGYTPLEGLVMQTRSGSIDPGLVLSLLTRGRYSAQELLEVLNKQSGLKALSGLSGDMRELEKARADGNKRATLAFDVYVESIATNIASLVPRLKRLDVLAFGGGIGENSAAVREAVSGKLEFLGVGIDSDANRSSTSQSQTNKSNGSQDRDISSKAAKVRTLVVHTKEELAIALDANRLLEEAGKKSATLKA
jgi:acetate kinase